MIRYFARQYYLLELDPGSANVVASVLQNLSALSVGIRITVEWDWEDASISKYAQTKSSDISRFFVLNPASSFNGPMPRENPPRFKNDPLGRSSFKNASTRSRKYLGIPEYNFSFYVIYSEVDSTLFVSCSSSASTSVMSMMTTSSPGLVPSSSQRLIGRLEVPVSLDLDVEEAGVDLDVLLDGVVFIIVVACSVVRSVLNYETLISSILRACIIVSAEVD